MEEKVAASISYRVIQLLVSEPTPMEGTPGLFVTKFSHPSLKGDLLLVHGNDREPLLKAVCIDPKELDPVSTLFKHIGELKNTF